MVLQEQFVILFKQNIKTPFIKNAVENSGVFLSGDLFSKEAGKPLTPPAGKKELPG